MEMHGHNISAICARRLYRSDSDFAAWLAGYNAEYGGGGKRTWTGLRHELWAVEISHVLDGAHAILFPGRNCAYLARVMPGDIAVLSVAPIPTPAEIKRQLALETAIRRVERVLMPILDPILKWGKHTCPRCYSRKMYPFKIESDDEPAHHQCLNCNTIWPPRECGRTTPTVEAAA